MPTETRHAVVSGGRLLCEIKCLPCRQIVVLFPRADPEGYPHATYHVDGTRQIRSRLGTGHSRGPGGKTHVTRGLPRLDAPIPTPVDVVSLGIRAGEGANFDPAHNYAGIVDVPLAAFDNGGVTIGVVIVAPGVTTPEHYLCERFAETDLASTCPPIRVTVWRPKQT